MLTLAEVSALIDSAERSIFRLEAQLSYNVTAADRDIARYLAGEETDMERKQRWLDVLRARVARGVELRHVRVLHPPLSDYERMVCEWSYPHYVRVGQRIRILEADVSGADFYLLDKRTIVSLQYSGDGQFIKATERAATADDKRYADELWSRAVPFTDWWAGHPEYHRNPAVT